MVIANKRERACGGSTSPPQIIHRHQLHNPYWCKTNRQRIHQHQLQTHSLHLLQTLYWCRTNRHAPPHGKRLKRLISQTHQHSSHITTQQQDTLSNKHGSPPSNGEHTKHGRASPTPSSRDTAQMLTKHIGDTWHNQGNIYARPSPPSHPQQPQPLPRQPSTSKSSQSTISSQTTQDASHHEHEAATNT